MKQKIKLASLIREEVKNEQMNVIRGGSVNGSCSCLCDGDIQSASHSGCKTVQNTGCTVVEVAR